MRPTLLLAWVGLTFGAPVVVLALGRQGWRLDLAVLAVSALAAGVVSAAERWAPFEPSWSTERGDTAVDRLHALFSTILVVAGFEWVAARVPSMPLWPSSLPLAVQVAMALLLAEFGGYWVHRLMHTTQPLWQVHLVHHSARRLHAANASRNHPLDSLLVLTVAALPLMVLGAPVEVLASVGALATVHLQFQHVNAQLELGWLNLVFAGPEVHRWHHSRVPEEANGNYGHVLSVWDLVFSTRIAPARRPPSDVGLFDSRHLDERYLAHLRAPFT